MRIILTIAVLAVLATFSVAAVPNAADKTPLEQMLESMGPMDQGTRAAFDKAARSMYREDCNCLTYIMDGTVKKVLLPIDDVDRRLLIEGLKRGLITPFGPNGQAS